MRVFHVGMLMTDGKNAVFEGVVLDVRWTNKAAGKWSGKCVETTDYRIEVSGPLKWCAINRAEIEEAAKRGLPALGPTFGMYCPSCGKLHCELTGEAAA